MATDNVSSANDREIFYDEGKNRDYAISIIRCIAMCLIVSCHFCQYYGLLLAEWFNVGVPLFFLISGFLYGTRKIQDPIGFVFHRFRKIFIPYYVFLLPVLMVYILFATDNISIVSIARMMFGADGISGINHLWFVSYIFFCYILTPYLYWIAKKTKTYSFMKEIFAFTFLIFFLFATGIIFNSYFRPDRIICYVIGYLIAHFYRKYGRNVVRNMAIFALGLCVIINGVRMYFLLNEILLVEARDVAEKFLNCCGQDILGISGFLILYLLLDRPIGKRFGELKIVKYMDNYSYSIYLIHQFFILSPFSLLGMTNYVSINCIFTIIVILCTSFIHKIISDGIERYMLSRDCNVER